ncbi:AAA family ATPase [Kribbella rubisoli]|uniref:AAA family ATPase n=1 Tax=Kribbella rubisoli TaxID=3075929 RepID=UPI001F546A03|nr:AAA family ATPase [Kribbella rubisoli]
MAPDGPATPDSKDKLTQDGAPTSDQTAAAESPEPAATTSDAAAKSAEAAAESSATDSKQPATTNDAPSTANHPSPTAESTPTDTSPADSSTSTDPTSAEHTGGQVAEATAEPAEARAQTTEDAARAAEGTQQTGEGNAQTSDGAAQTSDGAAHGGGGSGPGGGGTAQGGEATAQSGEGADQAGEDTARGAEGTERAGEISAQAGDGDAVQGSGAAAAPRVGVVYEPDESPDGFPLEYGNIIIGLPKQPENAAQDAAGTQSDAVPDDQTGSTEQQPDLTDAEASDAAVDKTSDATAEQFTEETAEQVTSGAAEQAARPAADESAETLHESMDDAADEAASAAASDGTDAAASAGESGAEGAAEHAGSGTEDVAADETAGGSAGESSDTTDESTNDASGEANDAEGEPANAATVESDGDSADGAADEAAEEEAASSSAENADESTSDGADQPVNGGPGELAGDGVDRSAGDGADESASGAEGESVSDGAGERGAESGAAEDAGAGAAGDTAAGDGSDEAGGDAAESAAGGAAHGAGRHAADGATDGVGDEAADETAVDGAPGEPVAEPADDSGDVAADGGGDAGATAVDESAEAAGDGGSGAVDGVAAGESVAGAADGAAADGGASDPADDAAGGGGEAVAVGEAAGAADEVADGESVGGASGGEADGAADGGDGSAEGEEELTAAQLAERLAAEQAAMALITALMKLRGVLAGSRLPLEVVGADEARQQQKAMLDQLDDYLLPRLVQLEAPVLAVVGGSTGAGKSTLVNTVIGKVVSEPGVLRPTTRSPVLIHHPADADWFVGDRVLPGMARTSSDEPGGMEDAGQLRLVAADTVPRGLAILDAPDIDSVVEANRDLATQLLGAADLWLFVTTAARYSDAVPWEFLQSASDRSTAVAVVLDRAPSETIDDITGHLAQMLLERGLGDSPLFSIQETVVDGNGMLPQATVASIKDWLVDLAADAEARAGVVRRTLQGAVSAMVKTTPPFAEAVKAQADTAIELRSSVESAYDQAVKDIAKACQDGTLLRGEVLARWQEFVGTGELLKGLQSNAGRLRDRLKTSLGNKPAETRDVSDAIQSGLESLLREHATAAAERAEKAWQATAPGRQLLAVGDAALAEEDPESSLGALSPAFPDAAARAVREWQAFVLDVIRKEGGAKKSTARILEYGVNGLGLSLMVVVFAREAGIPKGAEASVGAGSAVVGQRLLEAVFGDKAVQGMVDKAREDLDGKVHALMDAEFARYLAVLDQHPVDAETARQLTEAARAVEDCT